MKINKLLIANRGEIACRVARTCRLHGIQPIGIHSDADAASLHVREIGWSVPIGGTSASSSYLRIDAVIEAARSVGADAIHPGYGLLSENADFARAVENAGMAFVGPRPETLKIFGDKAKAKSAAVAAGVPVIAGSENVFSDKAKIAAQIKKMGLPVLLKAVGGGGGRGQRLVREAAEIESSIEGALREAKSSFGSEGLLIERLIERARHIEIQIVGDGQGNVVHLYERDCSLQRRHQKVVEEAPAPNLDRTLAEAMAADAVKLGKSVDYRSLGTVEFLVADGKYYFLEVNPRLQVEHPATELVTGLDLVGLQLGVIAGSGLGIAQNDVKLSGHAIEARIYAEDASRDFVPSTGKLETVILCPAPGLRVDAGVEAGDTVTPYYDSMIAKMIAMGSDRDEALNRLRRGLDASSITGVTTNVEFLNAILDRKEFRDGTAHTRLIDQALPEIMASTSAAETLAEAEAVAAAVCLWACRERPAGHIDPWHRREGFTGWRLGMGRVDGGTEPHILVEKGGCQYRVRISRAGEAGFDVVVNDTPAKISVCELTGGVWQISTLRSVLTVAVKVTDAQVTIYAPSGSETFAIASPLDAEASRAEHADGLIVAPLMGQLVKVAACQGAYVKSGDVIAILESMKMEISIRSPHDGVVLGVSCAEGDMVERGQTLLELGTE